MGGEGARGEGRVHGRVYAVDDAWLAALDALHCAGTRCSVEVELRPAAGDAAQCGTAEPPAADAAGATDAGGAETIICQSWLLQADSETE